MNWIKRIFGKKKKKEVISGGIPLPNDYITFSGPRHDNLYFIESVRPIEKDTIIRRESFDPENPNEGVVLKKEHLPTSNNAYQDYLDECNRNRRIVNPLILSHIKKKNNPNKTKLNRGNAGSYYSPAHYFNSDNNNYSDTSTSDDSSSSHSSNDFGGGHFGGGGSSGSWDSGNDSSSSDSGGSFGGD